MIDTKLEEFSANEAVDAGLIDAIKSGTAKISGTYELTPDGEIVLNQNNFVFKDKGGNLRAGQFETATELVNFCQTFGENKSK